MVSIKISIEAAEISQEYIACRISKSFQNVWLKSFCKENACLEKISYFCKGGTYLRINWEECFLKPLTNTGRFTMGQQYCSLVTKYIKTGCGQAGFEPIPANRTTIRSMMLTTTPWQHLIKAKVIFCSKCFVLEVRRLMI